MERGSGAEGCTANSVEVVRSTLATVVMTVMRRVTMGFGFVERIPPDAIIKQRAVREERDS